MARVTTLRQSGRAGAGGAGAVTSLRKARPVELSRTVDVQVRTDVDDMLFKVPATPDR